MVAHAKNEVDGFESTFRTRDRADQWRWVLARGRVTARDRSGWAQRMLGTVHDVTALKDAETELRHLNEGLEQRVAARTAELSQTNAELMRSMHQVREAQLQLVESEKMAALGSLVAGVAHEINTPLGIGVTSASHLERVFTTIEGALAANTDTTLGAALAAGRRCVDLVLRNLGRADQLVKSFKQIAIDQSTEEARRLKLRDYLNEVLVSLQPVLKRRPLQIVLECEPTLEIHTYAGAIYQIVMNLVVNSATHGFGPEDAGTLRIQVRAETDTVELSYRDDGRGMSAEVVARVFDPFFTTRRGSGGTGLGMHICYNLVTQRLRGTIRCESTPGAGVHFLIRFPRTTSPASASPGSDPRV
jgi:signal transduction histidine kinase